MSKVKIQGHASGSGTLTLGAPNTDSDRTLTLPDTTGTLLDENSSVPAANITGNIASARLTSVPAANVTGTLPASVLDTTVIENNIAMLAFFRASDNSKAKYSLVDQVVDEYVDATGVDAGNSTNESLAGGAYSGDVAPTHDADATGTDGGDTWYKWTDTGATGSFTPAANGSYDFLVIGGGGSGSFGGGGAGGFRTSYGSGDISGGLSAVESNLDLVSGTTYTMTVGAGRSPSDTGSRADTGDDSSIAGSDITNIVSLGGGMGGGATGNASPNTNGTAGGSGGGAGYDGTAGTGGAGAGKNSVYASWTALQPTGGTASPNTGSGGGGCNGGETSDLGGAGGSGIVIIRYAI